MPQFTGYFAIVGGALLVLGLLTKVASPGAVASIAGGVPARRGSLSPIPLRTAPNEVLLDFLRLPISRRGGGRDLES